MFISTDIKTTSTNLKLLFTISLLLSIRRATVPGKITLFTGEENRLGQLKNNLGLPKKN